MARCRTQQFSELGAQPNASRDAAHDATGSSPFFSSSYMPETTDVTLESWVPTQYFTYSRNTCYLKTTA